MRRSRRTIHGSRIAIVMAGALFVSGCASTTSTLSTATLQTPSDRMQSESIGGAANRQGPDGQPYGTQGDGTAAPTPDPMQQVIAEVQEIGELDPAAREELLENLRQTDPQLWPLVAQQFRASLAWRRRAEQREPIGPVRAAAAAEMLTSEPMFSERRPDDINSEMAMAEGFPRDKSPGDSGRRSPSADRVAAAKGDDQVVTASYDRGSSGDWRSHLAKAIEQFAPQVSASPRSEREFAEHARLRMLYLLADRRDEALQPIPALDPAMQEFWSGQLYGLAALMDTELISDPSQRKTEARRHLDESVNRLGESCSLAVRNLAFVTAIDDFGIYKPFKQYEFTPGQQVLLYAEIENFKSNETAKGHHTALRSSYQIFNSGGQRVAEHEFPTNEEYCRNPRRDFFMGYEFHLPERIFPGKHTLQLTVVDLNSQKIGQSLIEFSVKSNGR